jgi:hypothetical protein
MFEETRVERNDDGVGSVTKRSRLEIGVKYSMGRFYELVHDVMAKQIQAPSKIRHTRFVLLDTWRH